MKLVQRDNSDVAFRGAEIRLCVIWRQNSGVFMSVEGISSVIAVDVRWSVPVLKMWRRGADPITSGLSISIIHR